MPSENKVQVVQNISRFKWAGVPFNKRYSDAPLSDGMRSLRQRMRHVDAYLDLKFYLPTEKWHVVRHLDRSNNHWTRVWELDDKPEIGLRKEPGEWIIDALKAGDTWGAAENRVDEIDKNNQQVEESNKKEIEAVCGDVAKDMRKPLQHLYDFGDNGSYKGVY